MSSRLRIQQRHQRTIGVYTKVQWAAELGFEGGLKVNVVQCITSGRPGRGEQVRRADAESRRGGQA